MMAINIKDATKIISEFVSQVNEFSELTFEKYLERTYCAFVCDELNGIYERAYGGDYESSITFRYSSSTGLAVEVYISNNRAKMVIASLQKLVNDLIMNNNYESIISYSFTNYIPGESSLSYLLTTNPNSLEQFKEYMNLLGAFVLVVAERLQ